MQENISVTDSYSTGNAAQAMLEKLLQIYDVKTLVAQLNGVGENHWSAAILKRALANDSVWHRLSEKEFAHLQTLLPKPPAHHPHYAFRFIDLFAGIGGIRRGFESIGGQCVFTSEWNKHAVRTYKANHYCDPATHHFNEDIRDITLSHKEGVSDEAAAEHIRQHIPEHDVLLAGFPCQPFSLAGVSKKNSLGRAHGFACDTQGTLFFDVADAEDNGPDDPKIIDGKHFLPQHRERIVLVGFRRDLNLKADFTLRDISECFPAQRVTLAQLLDPMVEAKYILTPVLWKYLYRYAKKHQARGNGFGYGMVYPNNPQSVTRTLSARYYKDGAEILIDRGWDMATGEKDFDDPLNQQHRPRRLTPRECARLMGFEAPGEAKFRIPVSDTQAYRQFGNSVVVPVFAAVAKLLEPKIKQAVALRQQEAQHGRRSR